MTVPVSTYRIQFTPDFGFRSAREALPYLADLGITAIYASPIFQARPGSTHGYDVTDPLRRNPELGTDADFIALKQAIRDRNMGWVQDIVPNHMAFDSGNRMLMDVMEKGQRSRFHNFFDVDWDHFREGFRGRMLTPFLGRHYGEILADGEIRITYDEAGFAASYYDWRFPLAFASWPMFLGRAEEMITTQESGSSGASAFSDLRRDMKAIPDDTPADAFAEAVDRCRADLWELVQKSPEIKTALDDTIALFNSGDAEGLKRLDELLEQQVFRLAFWQTANQETNYRRFFHINDLISLRAEIPDVFDGTHSFILEQTGAPDGLFTGLRVDHVDGLASPGPYLQRLREKAGEQTYLVVEKILESEEDLPEDWPVEGTTGYDFMNRVGELFCDHARKERFSGIYATFTGGDCDLEELVRAHKLRVLEHHMAGDVNNLVYRLMQSTLSPNNWQGRDMSVSLLRKALTAILVRFPVYRTYLNDPPIRDVDVAFLRGSVEAARADAPELAVVIDYIAKVLLQEIPVGDLWPELAARFQQLTAPLAAKGFEDTTLYVYNRMISLNEVGGDPGAFGHDRGWFHNYIQKRVTAWPRAMNSSATHDTKRGEDVRARLHTLSEIPDEWERNVMRWEELNGPKRETVNRRPAPDANETWFLYQTLVGTFPFDQPEQDNYTRRVGEYMVKSMREAEVHTNWIHPAADYEEACVHFVEKLLEPSEENRFLKEFLPFQRKLAHYGVFNSLSQTLIKLTAPGVPDFYQGTELWDLSMVDPDNRRPVDYGLRATYLQEIQAGRKSDIRGLMQSLLTLPEDGRIKLFLIHAVLAARNAHAGLFLNGNYRPLDVQGEFERHVVAFARQRKASSAEQWSLTVVPRFLTGLVDADTPPLGMDIWQDTAVVLPPSAPDRWTDAVSGAELASGGTMKVGEILQHFPAACLISKETS